jgi:hypothetical protein
MKEYDPLFSLALGYRSEAAGRSRIVHADCFEWLGASRKDASTP